MSITASMSMITPDIVENDCISLLRRLHTQHLALLERERDLPARTIEPLRTIDLLAGDGFRLREDRTPCALLGIFGTASAPEPTKDWGLNLTWTLAIQIVVQGRDRQDTMRRRGWYAMTVAQCVHRLPRASDPVDQLRLIDIDLPGLDEGTQRTLGEARLLFDVTVRNALQLDALPLDDTDILPGEPGGPPDGDYTEPEPWPPITTVTINTYLGDTPESNEYDGGAPDTDFHSDLYGGTP